MELGKVNKSTYPSGSTGEKSIETEKSQWKRGKVNQNLGKSIKPGKVNKNRGKSIKTRNSSVYRSATKDIYRYHSIESLKEFLKEFL